MQLSVRPHPCPPGTVGGVAGSTVAWKRRKHSSGSVNECCHGACEVHTKGDISKREESWARLHGARVALRENKSTKHREVEEHRSLPSNLKPVSRPDRPGTPLLLLAHINIHQTLLRERWAFSLKRWHIWISFTCRPLSCPLQTLRASLPQTCQQRQRRSSRRRNV